MAQFLLGPGGKLILVGGKPLAIGVAAPVSTTTGITLTPFVFASATTPRFNIQTSAASGDTTADVPVIFAYTGGAPTSLFARIVDGTGAQVTAWVDITSSTAVNGGIGLGYLPAIPAGIGYRREVRVGLNGITDRDLTTKTFNVGWMVLPWGQSNMYNQLVGNLGAGGSAVPNTALTELGYYSANGTGAFFGKNGFVGSGNSTTIGSYETHWGGGLALLRHIGNRLQTRFGRKVGISLNPYAQKGTPFSGFVAGNNVSSMLANSGRTGGTIGFSSTNPGDILANGDYRVVLWHQGESADTGEVTRLNRRDNLIRFCQAHIAQVANFGRTADKLTFLFAIMGRGTAVPVMENLRGAVLDLIDYVAQNGLNWDVRIGWNCIDLQTGTDNLHITGDYQRWGLLRMAQAVMSVVDSSVPPASGPYVAGTRTIENGATVLTGATSRSGDTVTVSIVHGSGAGRILKEVTQGQPITGWYANTARDFSGTDLVVSNVQIVGNTVSLTIKDAAANSPVWPVYLKHQGGKISTAQSSAPDVSNMIYDDLPYPTGAAAADQLIGLPLQPTPDPIKVV